MFDLNAVCEPVAGATVLLDAVAMPAVAPVAAADDFRAVNFAADELAVVMVVAEGRQGRRILGIIEAVIACADRVAAIKEALTAFEEGFRTRQQDPDSEAAKNVRKVRKSELKAVLEAAANVEGFIEEIEANPGNVQALAKKARAAKNPKAEKQEKDIESEYLTLLTKAYKRAVELNFHDEAKQLSEMLFAHGIEV